MKKITNREELTAAIYDYLMADDKLFDECCAALNIKSTVSEDPAFLKPGTEPKKWAFIGFGCGITWLEFPKYSILAKMFEECYHQALRDCREAFVNKFDKATKDYYKSIGCPLEAIFWQDQYIQIKMYSRVAKFATEVLGFKKCEVESRLD